MKISEAEQILKDLGFQHRCTLDFPEHNYHCFLQKDFLVVIEESLRYNLAGEVNCIRFYGYLPYSSELSQTFSSLNLGGIYPHPKKSLYKMDLKMAGDFGHRLKTAIEKILSLQFLSPSEGFRIWIEDEKGWQCVSFN